MDEPVISSDLLGAAIGSYDAFARCHLRDAPDPEIGVDEAYACGRRALAARAAAEPWRIREPVATRVQVLRRALEAAPAEDAIEWLDRFPRAVLDAVDRRSPGAGRTDAPHRRFVDRLAAAGVPAAR